MGDFQKLSTIAAKQAGFFTAIQAESCGYLRTNHFYHVQASNWKSEGWGIYSLPTIPKNELSFYWLLYLWTRGKQDKPQAVISHETALSFYELSDVNPSKVHFTVPKSFRKTAKKPDVLVLYKKDLNKNEITEHQGLKITSVIKTLKDSLEDSAMSIELIEQAVKEALKRGMITKSELKLFPELLEYAI